MVDGEVSFAQNMEGKIRTLISFTAFKEIWSIKQVVQHTVEDPPLEVPMQSEVDAILNQFQYESSVQHVKP